MLIQSADDMEDVLDMSTDNLAALKEEAQMIKPEVLIRYIKVFSEVGSQIRRATQKRILIEIAIIKLCKPQMEQDYDSIIDRLDSIEKRIKNGVPVAAGTVANGQPAEAVPVKKAPLPAAVPDDITEVIKNWNSILSEIGGTSKVYMKKAVPTLGSNKDLQLVLDDDNAFAFLNENRAECITTLSDRIAERIGKNVEVTVKKNESSYSAKEVVPDLRDMIQFDIEEENF